MSFSSLRVELAATAARLIAEEGCEYAQAKRRAQHEIVGPGRVQSATMPDNSEIERELRRYLKLFGGDSHRSTLMALRRLAADWMQTLAEFDPHLVGAVLNGTATAYSDVRLQLFVDSAKDVELRLMDLGVSFDVEAAVRGERPEALEQLGFVAPLDGLPHGPKVGIRIYIYARDSIRVAPRHRRSVEAEAGVHPIEASGRANLAALERLMQESERPC